MQFYRGMASGWRRSLLPVAAAIAIGCGCSGTAGAAQLAGTAELAYTLLDSRPSRPRGVSLANTTESFSQKYNVSLDVNPYPNLRFTAGTSLEFNQDSTRSGGGESSSSSNSFYPYLGLSLGNPLYSISAGYGRKQDSAKTSGSSRSTLINEEYHANLGWKPEGFPILSILLSRNNNFDADRFSSDSTSDNASLGLRYTLFKDIDLKFQGSYNNTTDRISHVATTTLGQSGMARYSRQFFTQRVALYASYNFNRQESTTDATGTVREGELVDFQLFPFSGLANYSLPDEVAVTSAGSDQNAPNPAVMDGNLTVGAGINLGVVPTGGDPAKVWSIGLDFFNNVEINKLHVWLNRGDLTTTPVSIADFFSWDVYVRSTPTDEWRQVALQLKGTFDPFLNRFMLTIPQTTTRFIKVVVAPLTQAGAATVPNFPNPGQILVTELQAFTSRPVQQVQGSTVSTSHFFTLDVRSKILNSPSLHHSFSLLFSTGDSSVAAGSSTKYTIANSLNLNHKLGRIFIVGANVGVEQSSAPVGSTTSFVYNANLKANPLSGLSHTLLYSGRTELARGERTSSNSFFLYNSIQPYRGISFSLSGGMSESSSSLGAKSDNTQLIGGMSLAPMRDLNISLSYSRSWTTTSTASTPAKSTSTQSGSLSSSYRPFAGLYLSASLGVNGRENGKTEFSQSYSFNWTPFSDGDLQLSLMYSESLNSSNDSKNTMISPSASWKITPRTLLDVSYPIFMSESTYQKSTSTILSATLRTSF